MSDITAANLIFSDPAKKDANLVFGESASDASIVIAAALSISLAPPQVTIDTDLLIDATLSGNTGTATPAIDAEMDLNLPDTLAADTTAAWERAVSAENGIDTPWNIAPYMDAEATAAWEKAKNQTNAVTPIWEQPPATPAGSGDQWEQGQALDAHGRGDWKTPPQNHIKRGSVWHQGEHANNAISEAFTYPPFVTPDLSSAWELALQREIEYRDAVRYADPLSNRLIALWEYGILPPLGRSLLPESEDPLPVPEPFRGGPDLLFNGDFEQPIPEFTNQAVYILMPQLTLYRLSDGSEIAAKNVTWTTDADSWGWRFNATLSDNASLALIRPDSSGPREIGCEINGHTFTAIVESYSVTRQFGEAGYQIKGRSLSGWLSDPYAPKRSQVITTDYTAQQLAALELQNTGWALDWQTADWTIPAGAFSYQDKDPIAVIKQVAESVGAIVQSHQSSKTIIVKPRYPVSPHLWAGATVDATMPGALIKHTASDYRSLPNYNRAISAGGDTGGVIVTVTRDGTAGDELAPIVTDSLITHADAGYERGRNEIAKGGSWESMNISTWLTTLSEAGPGLILPGHLVEVQDVGETYRVQIGSTSITAQSSNDALTVRQALTAERAFI